MSNYMPYGYANHSGSTSTPYQWLGGYGVYYDAATDLHLTLHRAYSCKTKRFLQPDPLGIDGGANVYAMANLNPFFFIDPYGLNGLESQFNDTLATAPIPCIYCHGYGASGRVPGTTLTQSLIPGLGYFDSGSTGNIIGNFSAGAAGGAVSLPQRLINAGLWLKDAAIEVWDGATDLPSYWDYTNAEATQSAVQRFVYKDVDPNSLITQSGTTGGDLVAGYGLGKLASFAGSRTTSWLTSGWDDAFSGWFANSIDDTVYGAIDDAIAIRDSYLPAPYYGTNPYNGFPNNWGSITFNHDFLMQPGMQISRIGPELDGFFTAPVGTPIIMRSIPGTAVENIYDVLRPFTTQRGITAPAYGQIGLGTQDILPYDVTTLKKWGWIKDAN